jgi:hypothetical protein
VNISEAVPRAIGADAANVGRVSDGPTVHLPRLSLTASLAEEPLPHPIRPGGPERWEDHDLIAAWGDTIVANKPERKPGRDTQGGELEATTLGEQGPALAFDLDTWSETIQKPRPRLPSTWVTHLNRDSAATTIPDLDAHTDLFPCPSR